MLPASLNLMAVGARYVDVDKETRWRASSLIQILLRLILNGEGESSPAPGEKQGNPVARL